MCQFFAMLRIELAQFHCAPCASILNKFDQMRLLCRIHGYGIWVSTADGQNPAPPPQRRRANIE